MAIFNQVVSGGGTTPTGTIQITTNGTHDVTNYATADVNVPTTAPAHYVEKSVDANGVLQNSANFIDLTGASDIGAYVLNYAYAHTVFPANTVITIPFTIVNGSYALQRCFYTDNQHNNYNNNIIGFSCPNLKIISGYGVFAYAFQDGGRYLTNINLDSLEEISGNGACESMFTCGNQYGPHSLTQASLPKLKKITNTKGCCNMFWYQINLSSFEMPELEIVTGGQACEGMLNATAITSFKFQSLNLLTGTYALRQMFSYCSNLQSLWFYALNTDSFGTTTNQFSRMLTSNATVTVHFPIRIQSTIGSWSDVTSGFAGTNTTVLFDIVTTLTGADGNTYTRQEKDSTTTATAWVYNDTLYYTSGVSDNTNGVNEPAVGDTIYSDSSCTTAVTTIATVA